MYIPNKAKMARLLKNSRLENFESPCDTSWAVLRYIPNEDKTGDLFKNLRLEIFASPKVVLRYISPMKTRQPGSLRT